MARHERAEDDWPTGAQLAARLEAWAEAQRIPIIRLNLHLFGHPQGTFTLRKSKRPHAGTVRKVEAFLRDPVHPDRLPQRQRLVRAPRVNPKVRSLQINRDAADFDHAPYEDPVKAARRAAKVKASIRRQAAHALANGIPAHKASRNAGVRGAMKELAENAAAANRATNPIEQAKLAIQRRGTRCFDARVTLGEAKGKGKYFINNRLVTEAELLAYAERLQG